MKLADYMMAENLDAEAMASRLGNASPSGVTKWAREERFPRPEQLRRIFEVTDGKVTPNDFVGVAA